MCDYNIIAVIISMHCKFILSVIIAIYTFSDINCLDLGFKNVVKSTVDVTTGLAKDVANKLPTPTGLFETSKQVIAGYPFEFVSSSINTICKCCARPSIALDVIKVIKIKNKKEENIFQN